VGARERDLVVRVLLGAVPLSVGVERRVRRVVREAVPVDLRLVRVMAAAVGAVSVSGRPVRAVNTVWVD